MKDIKFVSAFSSDLGRQRETALRILAQNAGRRRSCGKSSGCGSGFTAATRVK